MGQNKWLWIAGIAVVGYLLYRKGIDVYSKIEYGFTRIRFGRFSATPQGVGVEATVIQPITNRSNLPVPLNALEGVIKYGNDTLATFRLDNPIVIEPGQTTDVVLRSNVDLIGALTEVQEIVNTQQFLQALSFKGSATSLGINFPFNHTVQIG